MSATTTVIELLKLGNKFCSVYEKNGIISVSLYGNVWALSPEQYPSTPSEAYELKSNLEKELQKGLNALNEILTNDLPLKKAIALVKAWYKGAEKHELSISTNSLHSAKVGVTFYHSSDFCVDLKQCTNEELFWLIDQKPLFWRYYELWSVFSEINNRMAGRKEKGHNAKYAYTEIIPCQVLSHALREKSRHVYPQGELVMPFSSVDLKKMYEVYDFISTQPEIRYGEFFKYHQIQGLYGVKIAESNSVVRNPNNWIIITSEHLGVKNKSDVDYHWFNEDQNKLAYAIFCGQAAPIAFLQGKAYELCRYEHILKAQFDYEPSAYSGISNNSYQTTSNGCVSSFSGSTKCVGVERKTNRPVEFSVYGTSPQGDAWAVTKEGSVYFEF